MSRTAEESERLLDRIFGRQKQQEKASKGFGLFGGFRRFTNGSAEMVGTEGESSADVLDILEAMQNRSSTFRNRGPHPNPSSGLLANFESTEIQEKFAIAGVVLGSISVMLNLFVLGILLGQRRSAFKHVFYLFVLNFCIIDFLKGCSLILFSTVKTLDLSHLGELSQKIGGGSEANFGLDNALSRREQKLMIVKIEQTTLFVLRFCNLGTILNVLLITLNEFAFIKFPLSYHRWITRGRSIVALCLIWTIAVTFTLATTFARSQYSSLYAAPCDKNGTEPAMKVANSEDNSTHTCFYRSRSKQNNTMQLHHVFMFTLIAFCLFCLAVVLVCYTITFLIIYRIQRQDAAIVAETENFQRRSRKESCSTVFGGGARRMSEISGGQDSMINGGGGMEERRIKKHIVRRYKYVLVIGSVILVYMLYLISYTTIQITQYRRVRRRRAAWSTSTFIVQWSLQMLVGLHAVIQPLCYFRIKEFRRFVNKAFGKPCQRKGRCRDGGDVMTAVDTESVTMSLRSNAATVGGNGCGERRQLLQFRSISSPNPQSTLSFSAATTADFLQSPIPSSRNSQSHNFRSPRLGTYHSEAESLLTTHHQVPVAGGTGGLGGDVAGLEGVGIGSVGDGFQQINQKYAGHAPKEIGQSNLNGQTNQMTQLPPVSCLPSQQPSTTQVSFLDDNRDNRIEESYPSQAELLKIAATSKMVPPLYDISSSDESRAGPDEQPKELDLTVQSAGSPVHNLLLIDHQPSPSSYLSDNSSSHRGVLHPIMSSGDSEAHDHSPPSDEISPLERPQEDKSSLNRDDYNDVTINNDSKFDPQRSGPAAQYSTC